MIIKELAIERTPITIAFPPFGNFCILVLVVEDPVKITIFLKLPKLVIKILAVVVANSLVISSPFSDPLPVILDIADVVITWVFRFSFKPPQLIRMHFLLISFNVSVKCCLVDDEKNCSVEIPHLL